MKMSNTDYIHLIAGVLVFTGTILAWLINPYWLILPAFVGLNLFQFSLTKWCPLEIVLQALRKSKD